MSKETRKQDYILKQVSFDIIIRTYRNDKDIEEIIASALGATLLQILKARIGITEVVHTMTDKGPIYMPVKELKEAKDGESRPGEAGGETATSGELQARDTANVEEGGKDNLEVSS